MTYNVFGETLSLTESINQSQLTNRICFWIPHFPLFDSVALSLGFIFWLDSTLKSLTSVTRNSSGDEIANVNFLYDDIVHAVKIQ